MKHFSPVKRALTFIAALVMSVLSLGVFASEAHAAFLETLNPNFSNIPHTNVLVMQDRLDFKNASITKNTLRYNNTSFAARLTDDGVQILHFGQIPKNGEYNNTQGEVQVVFQNVGYDSAMYPIDLKVTLSHLVVYRTAGSDKFILFGKNKNPSAPYLYIAAPDSALAYNTNASARGGIRVRMTVEAVRHTELGNIASAEPATGEVLWGFDRIDTVKLNYVERVILRSGYGTVYKRANSTNLESQNDNTSFRSMNNVPANSNDFSSGILTNALASKFEAEVRTSRGSVYVLRSVNGHDPDPAFDSMHTTVRYKANAGGSIVPGGTTGEGGEYTYAYNSDATFTVTPSMGNTIRAIKIDGIEQEIENRLIYEHTFENIKKSHTVEAWFNQDAGEINITTTTTDEMLRQELGLDFTGAMYAAYADKACTQPVFTSEGLNLTEQPQAAMPDGKLSYRLLKFTGTGPYYEAIAGQPLYLDADGKETTSPTRMEDSVEVPNDPYWCTDDDGNTLLDAEGNPVQMTSPASQNTQNGNKAPVYYVKQVSAPDGMLADPTVYEINLVKDVSANLTFTDQLRTAKLSLSVKSSEEAATSQMPNMYSLDNSEFAITNTAGDVVDTIVTDRNGNAESKFLPVGEYFITQTKAGKGFVVNGETIAFAVTENDLYKSDTDFPVKQVTITNSPNVGTLSLSVQSTASWTGINKMYDFSSLKFRISGPAEFEVSSDVVKKSYFGPDQYGSDTIGDGHVAVTPADSEDTKEYYMSGAGDKNRNEGDLYPTNAVGMIPLDDDRKAMLANIQNYDDEPIGVVKEIHENGVVKQFSVDVDGAQKDFYVDSVNRKFYDTEPQSSGTPGSGDENTDTNEGGNAFETPTELIGPNGEENGVYTRAVADTGKAGTIEFGADTPDDDTDDKTYEVDDDGNIIDPDATEEADRIVGNMDDEGYIYWKNPNGSEEPDPNPEEPPAEVFSWTTDPVGWIDEFGNINFIDFSVVVGYMDGDNVVWGTPAPPDDSSTDNSGNGENGNGTDTNSESGLMSLAAAGGSAIVIDVTYDEIAAGKTWNLPVGSYTIEQIDGPREFALVSGLNDIIIANAGTITPRTVKYRPLVNTDKMTVTKFDVEGWNDDPSKRNVLPIGGVTLDGASYRISYYDGMYSTADEITRERGPQWVAYASTAQSTDGSAQFAFPDDDRNDDGYVVNGASTLGFPVGTYVIEEDAAPEGYALNEDAYLVQVRLDDAGVARGYVVQGKATEDANAPVNEHNTAVVMDEPEKSDIIIFKTGSKYITNDEIGEETIPLAGVEFQIINNSNKPIISVETGEYVQHGQVLYTITTDAQGTATTSDIAKAHGFNYALSLGDYVIHESKGAPGYAASEDVEVSVTEAGKIYRYDLENRTGTAIEIVKKSTHNNNIISASAKYNIVKEDGTLWQTSNGISEFTSSASGKLNISEKLLTGNYKLRETQAPRGFEVATNDVPFTIDETTVNKFSNPMQVEIFDDPLKCDAVIYIVDGENNSRINGKTVVNIKTRDAIKDDSGAEFLPANYDLGNFETENGEITLPNLHPGTYIITQLESADGYLINAQPYELYIAQYKSEEATTLDFPNYPRKGGIKVTNYTSDPEWTDATDWVIKGTSTFEVLAARDIYNNDGELVYPQGQLVETMVTNENGFAQTDDYFVQGEYIVREKTAPSGYRFSDPIEQTVTMSDETINAGKTIALSFYHAPQRGTIRIAMTDAETGRPVTASLATFDIYASEMIRPLDGHLRYATSDFVETITTDGSGYATSSKLYTGAYYIRERTAPDGYIKNPNVVKARVVYTGQNNDSAYGDVSEIGMTSEKIHGNLHFTAWDSDLNAEASSTGMVIEVKADQEFRDGQNRLLYSKGQVVDTVTIASADDRLSMNLPIGKYTVEELRAPNGYRLNPEKMSVEITSTGKEQAAVIKDVRIDHVGQRGTITIQNVHADTGELVAAAGSTYTVTAINDIANANGEVVVPAGTVVDTVTMLPSGTGTSQELLFGEYDIKQNSVPAGYLYNGDSKQIELGNGNQAVEVIDKTVSFSLVQPKAESRVTIADANTKSNIRVSGVGIKAFAKGNIVTPEGRVIYKAGDEVTSARTDSNGRAYFGMLHAGSYKVKATSTPEGYNRNYTEYDMTVSATVNSAPASSASIPFQEQLGVISVSVFDDLNKTIASSDSKFSVIAVDDIIGKDGVKRHSRGDVVASLSATNGSAATAPLAIGRYKVVQDSVANGYVIAKDEFLTAIVYAGDSSNAASGETLRFVNAKQASTPVDPPKPAPIQLIANGHYVIATNASASSTKVIDISAGSTANRANAQIWSRNNTDAQVFTFAYDKATDTYRIRNYNSQKYLTVANGTARDAANVHQEGSSTSKAQKWKISQNPNGTYTIKSAMNENFVLDLSACSTVNGSNVQIWTSNGTTAQQWNIIKTTPIAIVGKTITDETYTLVSGLSSSKVLDISAASRFDGANAQIWTSNGTNAQKFAFKYDGKGFYTIRNIASGKYLDAAAAGTVNGTNVQQWTGNGTDAQKWSVRKTSGGYTIANKLSGKMLDVDGARNANGTNVHLWTPNGTVAQKWALRK